VLDHVVPRLGELRDPGLEPVPWFQRRLALYAAWPRACGLVLGLSGLLGPELAPAAPPHTELALELADGLRISRDLRRELASTWELALAFRSNPDPARATRLRWMRRPGFLYALALARAWRIVTHARTSDLDALAAERAALSPDELDAAPWIAARDLEERNVPKGPLYGLVLAEAETLQLDRVLQSRADALAWLERRLQDGGNARRNA
jgi:hypothetical protein